MCPGRASLSVFIGEQWLSKSTDRAWPVHVQIAHKIVIVIKLRDRRMSGLKAAVNYPSRPFRQKRPVHISNVFIISSQVVPCASPTSNSSRVTHNHRHSGGPGSDNWPANSPGRVKALPLEDHLHPLKRWTAPQVAHESTSTFSCLFPPTAATGSSARRARRAKIFNNKWLGFFLSPPCPLSQFGSSSSP